MFLSVAKYLQRYSEFVTFPVVSSRYGTLKKMHILLRKLLYFKIGLQYKLTEHVAARY